MKRHLHQPRRFAHRRRRARGKGGKFVLSHSPLFPPFSTSFFFIVIILNRHQHTNQCMSNYALCESFCFCFHFVARCLSLSCSLSLSPPLASRLQDRSIVACDSGQGFYARRSRKMLEMLLLLLCSRSTRKRKRSRHQDFDDLSTSSTLSLSPKPDSTCFFALSCSLPPCFCFCNLSLLSF